MMPNGAWSSSRSFFSGACGEWSLAITSSVPSLQPGDQRRDVGRRAQRRVHLEVAVEAAQLLVGQKESAGGRPRR